jgi:hypothetical protein
LTIDVFCTDSLLVGGVAFESGSVIPAVNGMDDDKDGTILGFDLLRDGCGIEGPGGIESLLDELLFFPIKTDDFKY